MSSELYILSAGFILGIQHAFDADHVVAVSTIVSENKNLLKSSLLGALWGLGHTFTLLLAGIAVLFLKLAIPAGIAPYLEMLVGFMLVALGSLTAYRALSKKLHEHSHYHGKQKHMHLHDEHSHSSHEKRSFIVGMVHGLAGSAALMLLVLGTVKSQLQGILYIGLFGLGSVTSMMIVTTILGLPFAVTAAKFEKFNTLIRLSAGIIGILLGSFIVYEIVITQGLFPA